MCAVFWEQYTLLWVQDAEDAGQHAVPKDDQQVALQHHIAPVSGRECASRPFVIVIYFAVVFFTLVGVSCLLLALPPCTHPACFQLLFRILSFPAPRLTRIRQGSKERESKCLVSERTVSYLGQPSCL